MDEGETLDSVRSAQTLTIADDRHPSTPPRSPIERGTPLGRYLVLDKVGEGGMGVVVRAYDPKLHREIALKRLHRDALDSDGEARLLREAQAMAQLSHPNVVTIYDVERTDDGVVMAMEYAEGQTLTEWVTAVDRPWREIVECFERAGRGLAAAHLAGLVHRDFKPGNVIVGSDGRVRVMDFGLARTDPGIASDVRSTEADREPPDASDGAISSMIGDRESNGSLSVELTQAGAVMGTPAYMSTEQHRGETADARSDQYAFCVSLWESLTGKRPFKGNLRAIAHQKHAGPPSVPRGSKVPRRIWEALRRGMSPRPHERWPSMAALLDALAWDPSRRRRQWLTAAATLTLAGGLGAAALVWPQDTQSPCRAAAEELTGVWDDARRTELRDALEGTALRYATPLSDRVSARLDAYAEDWTRMHVEACEATAVTRVQSAALLDLRMQCLRRRKLHLHAVVDVLGDADADVAETAIQQVMGLPPIDGCADTEALTAEVPPPEHPQVARAAEQLRDELTRVRVLTKAGRYDDARAALDPLLERAAALDYAPIHAHAMAASSTLAKLKGDYARAAKEGTEAYELALRSGADRIAASAAADVMHATGGAQAKVDIGWAWAASARALAQRTDPGGSSEGMVLNGMGVLAYRDGDFALATDYFEQALPILTRAVGEDDDRVATTLNHLGAMLDEQGRYAQAEPHFRRALEIQRRVFGTDHPRPTISMGNLALCLQGQGRNEEARDMHLEALAVRVRALGDEHPDTALTHNNLGWDYMGLGDADQAMEHFGQARDIFVAALGPEHPRVAMAAESLALAALQLDRYDEAETLHRQALELRRKALGEDHPNVALSLNGLGAVAFERERYDEAIELNEQALAILEARSEGAERYLGDMLTSLGRSLIGAERFNEARVPLERALKLRVEADGMDPTLIAKLRLHLAEAAWGEGATDEARASVRQGLEDLADAPSDAAQAARDALNTWQAEHATDPTQPD